MLGPNDLVLCAGTLLQASFVERVEAAAAAGYSGILLWSEDYQRARAAGLSPADMLALLDDHGLQIGELDAVTRWLPGSDALPDGPFNHPVEELLEVAEAVGGRSLNVVEIFGMRVPIEAAAEAFAHLCDRANDYDLLVHLEFLPWSAVPDLASAWEIVRLAGRDNGGVLLDTWHHIRSGQGNEALRAVPGERIFALQLSDAPAGPDGEMLDETMRRRRLPGAGDGNLAEVIRVLDEIGCEAPVGVEVFSDELATLPPVEVARRTADATRRVLAAARQSMR
jgi:sugar phosphate isomerase/epimerase